jgi:hypothetical protein
MVRSHLSITLSSPQPEGFPPGLAGPGGAHPKALRTRSGAPPHRAGVRACARWVGDRTRPRTTLKEFSYGPISEGPRLDNLPGSLLEYRAVNHTVQSALV